MTPRMSREEAARLQIEASYRSVAYDNASDAVEKLATDYLALLDERDALQRRQDWPAEDVTDAVNRLRHVADYADDEYANVNVQDLGMLFASADGLADSYSTVLYHITDGMLSKPTTDPNIAISIADDKENERFKVLLEDELAAATPAPDEVQREDE